VEIGAGISPGAQVVEGVSLEGAREAWSLYLSRGAIRSDLLRKAISRAGERPPLAGSKSCHPHADRLSELDTERTIARERALMAAAAPYLVALSRAAGDDRHAAMLANAGAIVLGVQGDPESVSGPERVPSPGALCSEAVSGANGIGSALAERSYVEIVGPEHFIGGFHPFTCQGIPLRDPLCPDGEHLVGVLSVSVRRDGTASRLRELLLCAAHGIEAELLRSRLDEDVRQIAAAGEPSEELIEQLRQDIVQVQAACRLKIEMAARAVARSRVEESVRLVSLAEQLSAVFSRRALLWRDLAAADVGAPEPVALDPLVQALVDLLETEARVRGIKLIPESAGSVAVEADPRSLARTLFRSLLRAMDAAGPGSSVLVHVGELRGAALAEVGLQLQPAGSPEYKEPSMLLPLHRPWPAIP
jgi:sigma-54 dependent transcriptional regulator, acetoin dehydrogenase operon transcriptional activator AcoR